MGSTATLPGLQLLQRAQVLSVTVPWSAVAVAVAVVMQGGAAPRGTRLQGQHGHWAPRVGRNALCSLQGLPALDWLPHTRM